MIFASFLSQQKWALNNIFPKLCFFKKLFFQNWSKMQATQWERKKALRKIVSGHLQVHGIHRQFFDLISRFNFFYLISKFNFPNFLDQKIKKILSFLISNVNFLNVSSFKKFNSFFCKSGACGKNLMNESNL